MSHNDNGSIRLHINWTRCDGRGVCTELLPRELSRDEWGYPLPKDGSTEPIIRRESMRRARDAVRLCPRLAVTLRAGGK
ncbi:ferredoxin [Nocardia sp. 348MFTsu5.1]|uniref:ferredoxin n=1 Tax=Nocardia sp. 348MFTsu5.1 TaxID=1172185 RepID=UPI000376385B|nr:ferredoxin [Nocardia sp. 348MFTsu5.1]